ncbi:hypothetical protein BTJ44_03480 [Bacillus mycoides]|nr:hypothetical protein BTJ44_03480 [Bacillus mycoides]
MRRKGKDLLLHMYGYALTDSTHNIFVTKRKITVMFQNLS